MSSDLWRVFLISEFKKREFAAKEKLEIVNALGFLIHFARPTHSKPRFAPLADLPKFAFSQMAGCIGRSSIRNAKIRKQKKEKDKI